MTHAPLRKLCKTSWRIKQISSYLAERIEARSTGRVLTYRWQCLWIVAMFQYVSMFGHTSLHCNHTWTTLGFDNYMHIPFSYINNLTDAWSWQDLAVHECTAKFGAWLFKRYLHEHFELHNFVFDDADTHHEQSGLLSPHQFGWPAYRPRPVIWTFIWLLTLLTVLLWLWLTDRDCEAVQCLDKAWILSPCTWWQSQHSQALPTTNMWTRATVHRTTGLDLIECIDLIEWIPMHSLCLCRAHCTLHM